MSLRRSLRSVLLCFCVAVTVLWMPGVAQAPAQARAFATRIEQLSEPGGEFDTDNLISNEQSYLDVVPGLRTSGVTGGTYIGVGPDQNFSYIAQIRPSSVYLVDIRRDNLLLHLLFKALFIESQTRIEYISLLTGRPFPERTETWRDASLERIVAYIDQTRSPNDVRALRKRMDDRIKTFGISLSSEDFATIDRFHRTFITAGLSLKFETHGRAPRSYYPTFRDLIVAADRNGRQWNYLASEGDFQFVRGLQLKDLVVPVVGDLGGTQALAAVSASMADRGERLSAFYISNVETYLYGDKYSRFVTNLRRLPHDAQSVLIRSIFRGGGSTSEIEPVNRFLLTHR